MAQILVRNLKPETVEALKLRARNNRRSLESEVRELLESAADPGSSSEYREFLREIAQGTSKNVAFRSYLEAIRERQKSRLRDSMDSAEVIRQARDERIADPS